MGETITNQNDGAYESSTDNLKEVDWAKIQMTNTLKTLKLNQENSFYTVDKDNKKVSYDMDAVKDYLNLIKDRSWKELTKENTGAWIMAVQIALEVLGQDVGQIDGIIGNQTKDAIIAFQTANGLKPDGAPGKQTIKKILEELEDLNIQTNPANPQNSNDNNIDIPEKSEIPQELKNFRQAWRERISNLSDDLNNEDKLNEILTKLDQIPVKVETDKEDGSRLIEFELSGTKWKILDPKLKTHSDSAYFSEQEHTYITKRDHQRVTIGGMKGDLVEDWENQKLKEYVQEKEGKGLHIAKVEEMKNLLGELGKQANLSSESDQIAMLMYLTGMDGLYWLSMGDDKNSNSQANSRSLLICDDIFRWFSFFNLNADGSASLCMIACN